MAVGGSEGYAGRGYPIFTFTPVAAATGHSASAMLIWLFWWQWQYSGCLAVVAGGRSSTGSSNGWAHPIFTHPAATATAVPSSGSSALWQVIWKYKIHSSFCHSVLYPPAHLPAIQLSLADPGKLAVWQVGHVQWLGCCELAEATWWWQDGSQDEVRSQLHAHSSISIYIY